MQLQPDSLPNESGRNKDERDDERPYYFELRITVRVDHLLFVVTAIAKDAVAKRHVRGNKSQTGNKKSSDKLFIDLTILRDQIRKPPAMTPGSSEKVCDQDCQYKDKNC
jgi:hypothetical protein